MGFYLLRRLAGLAVTVVVVSFLAYTALTFAPGDAAAALIGEHASAEQVAALRAKLRLDEPLLQRYGKYMAAALTRGDLGESLMSGRSVAAIVGERLPSTLALALLSFGLAALWGVTLGVAAAVHQGRKADLVIVGSIVLALALPPYWVGLLLIQAFSVRLGWLPVIGAGSLSHFVLPTVTLALPATAVVARLVRASVVEVMGSDFVRTARAKGLTPRVTMVRHVLPNSLIPALTMLGLNLGHLIGGAFVVETIFAWPGLGRLMVQAIFDRDIPVVMGAVLVVVPLCLLVNLLVDLMHALLDPRVRHEAI